MKKYKIILILTILMAVFTIMGNVSAADVFVNTTGNDNTGNGAIGNPYQSIGKGITESSSTSNAEDNRVILSNGTFTGNNNMNITISKNISIYGAKSLGLSTEDTIIDGENLNRIFNIVPGVTVNFYGIIFTNANASGSGVNGQGAAIYGNGSTINIHDSRFADNYANNLGGAIYGSNNVINIHDSIFIDNYAGSGGGAIYSTNCTMNITNSLFENNSASSGGAITSSGTLSGTLYVDSCNFTNNRARNEVAGAIFSSGTYGANLILLVNNSNFINNTGYGTAGAIYSAYESNISFSNFTGNEVFSRGSSTHYGGGAIYQYTTGKLFVFSSNFENNTGVYYGGAITTFAPTTIMTSNFTNNSVNPINNTVTTTFGGAIFQPQLGSLNISNCRFINHSGVSAGGAIASISNTIISNSYFYNNSAEEGGTIFKQYYTGQPILDVFNSTFVDNFASVGGVFVIVGSNFTITQSSFYNNSASENGSCIYFSTGYPWSVGNLSYCVFGNNSNVVFYNANDTSYITADYNFWGLNHIDGLLFNVTPNNYYVVVINTTAENNSAISSLPYNYYLVLNGTDDGLNSNQLPDFIVNIDHNNGNVANINGKNNYSSSLPINTNYNIVSASFLGNILDNFEIYIRGNDTLGMTIDLDKDEYLVNETVKGNISIINNGQYIAENITIKVTLPEGFILNNNVIVSKGYFDPVTNIWYVGDLNPNESIIMNFNGKFTNKGNYMFSALVEGNNFNESVDSSMVLVKDKNPNPKPNPNPNPNPDPNNDTNKTNKNKHINYPDAHASMKNTGMPIVVILLVLLSSLGLIVCKK